MKLIGIMILALLICENAHAQFNGGVKYIWQNDVTKINASVEIYSADIEKSKGCIYFITNVDTSFNSKPDSIFKQFIASSTVQCTIVKISFYNLYDSSKISQLSSELINFILPDVAKKYKNIAKATPILIGVNDYALVALHAAIFHSDKITNTALFFNEYQPNMVVCAALKSSSKLIKGKLFMYVNSEEENGLVTDSLAESLALNSSIVLYKYDDVNARVSKTIFTEAYNWLLADGNNYVLKTDD